MRIHKVLNNNAVVVLEDGQEKIVMGSGLGFQKRPNDLIDRSKIEKLFVLRRGNERFQELLEQTPEEVIDAAEAIISHAEGALATPFNDYIHIGLTDHLAYAIHLTRQGMAVPNKLADEIRLLYRDEYAVGLWALEYIAGRLGVRLPQSEAANIALHLYNARQQSPDMQESMRAATIIRELRSQMEACLGIELETDSLTYYRYITHMKLALMRVQAGRALHDMDEAILEAIRQRYAKAHGCACELARWLEAEYGMKVSDSEIGYMALHLERVRSKDQ